jgi:hypothetical protein
MINNKAIQSARFGDIFQGFQTRNPKKSLSNLKWSIVYFLSDKKFNLSHLHVYNRISHTNYRCSLLISFFCGLSANCSNISISFIRNLSSITQQLQFSASNPLALLEHVSEGIQSFLSLFLLLYLKTTISVLATSL